MSMFHNAKVCFAICTPIPYVTGPHGGLVLDTVSVRWHRARMSMSVPTNINMFELFLDGMEVGDARSKAIARCLAHKPVPEFMLFLDYDVLLPPDTLSKLFYRARCHPNYDIYAGVYCVKTQQPDPLIYGDNGMGSIWNWTVGDILTTESHNVRSCHMGLTLIRLSACQMMLDKGVVHGTGDDQDDEPFFKTISDEPVAASGAHIVRRGTEDIYFCHKLIEAGGKIMVDTGVLAGHENKATGQIFGLPVDDGPVKRAKWMRGNDGKSQDEELVATGPCLACFDEKTNSSVGAEVIDGRAVVCRSCNGSKVRMEPMKLAIDLGAGGERRQWPGHKTYTTDIRADSGPDYVQDSLHLTLPDNHFDLVASSHHLEHIGRWDQEKVWSEIFRICKPGGVTEHIVPNISWAAEKIKENDIDEHVINVLYGAQEAHGYERRYNMHYFGYTADIAKLLAEKAGFINVETQEWRQNEQLGYNLLIKGVKPLVIPAVEDSLDPSIKPVVDRTLKDANLALADELCTIGSSTQPVLSEVFGYDDQQSESSV